MNDDKSASSWSLDIDADGIAWLQLDKPGASANSLSRAVMEELDAVLISLTQKPPKALVVTSAKNSGFVAGADIKEFVGIQTPQQAYELIRAGQQVINRLATLPFTTVAAINGFALGGGLELALACNHRVLVNQSSATLGFPEVQLGVHPGLGGTVRAVRLIGPVAAMDLMLTGRVLRPEKALKLGLVDRLAASEQLREAARQLALHPPGKKRASLPQRLLNLSFVRPFLATRMRSEVAKRARAAHYPAPYALIELWQKYGGRGADAMDAEARSMSELLCTTTSRNLVRVFFLQERLKASGKSADATPTEATTKAKHVHVIGAGVMGGDIASWCAARGLNVTLQDREMKYIAPAMERAKVFFAKRYPDPVQRATALQRLKADVAGDGIAQADVVIEAIFENLDAKREVYARVEPQMKPDAVLATNTSSIVLEQLSAKLADPTRLIGLHYFNPVSRMPLVEVIRSECSNEAMLQRGAVFARQIDKLAIVCRSSPGFLVNRVLMPYLGEAIRAAEAGIALAVIDRAAENFGMPMGPIELADVVGLDVIMSVGKVFFAMENVVVPAPLLKLIEAKKFGKKSGSGFYEWHDGKPVKPDIAGTTTPADLEDRLLLPLVNEAVAVLREQIVADADLVDAGAIFGAGFAPFRGGPLQYARTRGVSVVVARLRELAASYGPRFEPDQGWHLLAESP